MDAFLDERREYLKTPPPYMLLSAVPYNFHAVDHLLVFQAFGICPIGFINNHRVLKSGALEQNSPQVRPKINGFKSCRQIKNRFFKIQSRYISLLNRTTPFRHGLPIIGFRLGHRGE